MFLFTVEGGDGSGKGLATKIISEILESEFSFPAVESTGEPRRSHPLGRLAIDSVRKKSVSPEEEAGLFAADRLDHSHGWILPRLLEGKAIVCERNIHSSLVYQGMVGRIGIDKVAHMNSAAIIPDLCIWVDCDPKIALNRIRNETLRGLSNKEEYFETSDFQIRIRKGYHDLLSGRVEMPTPFDMGAILGPIKNEGSLDQFTSLLKEGVRSFMHGRPDPINVDGELVDQHQIKSIIAKSKGQKALSGLGIEPARSKDDWLAGDSPWKVLKSAQMNHQSLLSSIKKTNPKKYDFMPKNILNHAMSSVCGTMSLSNSADISELRSAMGPVRCVSMRHTQRIVSFLKDLGWISQRKTLVGREAPKSQLKEPYLAYGRLALAIWPLRKAIRSWQIKNQTTHLRFSMGQIVKSGKYENEMRQTISRISILGSGSSLKNKPENFDSLVDWWLGK